LKKVPLQWAKPQQSLEGNDWSLEFKDFIGQCLRKELKTRPSLNKLLEV